MRIDWQAEEKERRERGIFLSFLWKGVSESFFPLLLLQKEDLQTEILSFSLSLFLSQALLTQTQG